MSPGQVSKWEVFMAADKHDQRIKTGITVIRLFFLALFILAVGSGRMSVWLALFALSLIAALFWGRIYCGYICPMNTAMIPADWLGRRLGIQTARAPAWQKSRWLAWVLLAASLVSVLLSRRLWSFNLPILPILLVLAVLVTLRYPPAVFHEALCPFGALQKLAGRKPRMSYQVDPQSCTGCSLCTKKCPSQAVSVDDEVRKARIIPTACHQCQNCRLACPREAIRYKSMEKPLPKGMA